MMRSVDGASLDSQQLAPAGWSAWGGGEATSLWRAEEVSEEEWGSAESASSDEEALGGEPAHLRPCGAERELRVHCQALRCVGRCTKVWSPAGLC